MILMVCCRKGGSDAIEIKNIRKEGSHMKTFKLFAVLLLTIVMLVTGCNGKESNTGTNNESQSDKGASSGAQSEKNNESQLPEPDDFSEKIDLTFAKVAFPPKENAPVIKKLEELYNINFGYINFERTKEGDLVALKIASGEVPDVFEVVGNMVEFNQYYKQGILRSIPEEYLKKYAPTVYETQKKYLKYLKFEGEIYGICGERLNNVYPLNAIWRKDWLDRLGIAKVPETLEEAEKAFYAFAKNDPDDNGKQDTYGLGKSGLDMIFGAYGSIPWGPWEQYWLWQKDDNGQLIYSAVKPEMKDALAVLSKWYKDGVIDPEFIVGENKGGYWAVSTDFVNNKIGFTGLAHFYHWMPPLREGESGGPVYKELKIANPDAELAYGKPVVGPNGHSGTWQYQVGVGAAEVIVLSNKVSDKQLIRYLQILENQVTNEDNRMLVEYGIKDVHWEFNKNGLRVRKADYENRERYHPEGIQLLNSIYTLENSRKEHPERYAWGDQHYDFPGYRSELVAALPSESKLRPDLDLLRDEYYISIITGQKPLDDFDKFVKKWYELGGDTLTKEANDWYSNLEQ